MHLPSKVLNQYSKHKQLAIFYNFRMKNLIIHNMWAVGMHHHGTGQLAVGECYDIEPEPENKYDKQAVRITDDGITRAYLKRDNARIISKLFEAGVGTIWKLKPKEEPVVKEYRTGPQQRCNLGCRCRSDELLEDACQLLRTCNIQYDVKEH